MGQASTSTWSGWLKRLLIFNFICLAWLFFRAPSVGEAWRWLGALGHWTWSASHLTALKFLLLFSIPLFVLDLVLELRQEEYPGEKLGLVTDRSGYVWRAGFAAGLLMLVFILGATEPSAFIYFQF